MDINIKISDYDYPLPQERIACFPLEERTASQLLLWSGGEVSRSVFARIGDHLPPRSTLVFNDTRVVRARLVMHRGSGARIEVFCLEPASPADYERAFAVQGSSEWICMAGNLKKWKDDIFIEFQYEGRVCRLVARRGQAEGVGLRVAFEWDAPLSFGQLLELLGRTPIPPYLCRESCEQDTLRYQTVYARTEGSVAAPTAGLHFTPLLIENLGKAGFKPAYVTLHVGAGTFLPVKSEDAADHTMHTEHFEIKAETLRALRGALASAEGRVVAVGTTTVRTLESLAALAWRIADSGSPDASREVGQWELYDIPLSFSGLDVIDALMGYFAAQGIDRLDASTQIMIVPGFTFRIVRGLVTNFHQPCSTLLLLVSAFTGGGWREIYDYALANDFRFLSYGDSSLLLP